MVRLSVDMCIEEPFALLRPNRQPCMQPVCQMLTRVSAWFWKETLCDTTTTWAF